MWFISKSVNSKLFAFPRNTRQKKILRLHIPRLSVDRMQVRLLFAGFCLTLCCLYFEKIITLSITDNTFCFDGTCRLKKYFFTLVVAFSREKIRRKRLGESLRPTVDFMFGDRFRWAITNASEFINFTHRWSLLFCMQNERFKVMKLIHC